MPKKITQEQFIEKVKLKHGDKYDYSKSEYKAAKIYLIIICPIHGEFNQTPDSHSRSGCLKCENERRTDSLEFFLEKAKKIHGNKYNYSNVNYINSVTCVNIICSEHGLFSQKPTCHITQKQGCPICGNRYSKKEKEWLDILKIPIEYRNNIIKIGELSFRPDAIDIENKIIWEFYGDYWHGNPNVFNHKKINKNNGATFEELYLKTKMKEKYLLNNGYSIISIWETKYKQFKKDISSGLCKPEDIVKYCEIYNF